MAPDFRRNRSGERDDSSKPVLITGARQSYRDELSARKRRYFLLMSVRIPALFLAAGAHALWHNPWITVAIVVGSIPIPWIAVIGANDRPPLPKGQARAYTAGSLSSYTPQALPSGITGGHAGDRPGGGETGEGPRAGGGAAPEATPEPPAKHDRDLGPHEKPDQPDESDPAQ